MDRANLDWPNLKFSYTKTDFHLEYDFKEGKWNEGKEIEKDEVTVSIAATALHYGQEAFEGLKVFEHKDGIVSAFRPDQNAKRFRRSAEKILMEPVPEELFIEAVERIVSLNKRYIPPYGA
ncbi:MAG: branched chain amino acid aminotransferase, partial [Caldithrix sp.]|nr:branched chain amino acid aminotransferase [Caldithrix sp.]